MGPCAIVNTQDVRSEQFSALQELLENDDVPRAALQDALKSLLAAEAAAAAAATAAENDAA